jgi:hypothetical protein
MARKFALLRLDGRYVVEPDENDVAALSPEIVKDGIRYGIVRMAGVDSRAKDANYHAIYVDMSGDPSAILEAVMEFMTRHPQVVKPKVAGSDGA